MYGDESDFTMDSTTSHHPLVFAIEASAAMGVSATDGWSRIELLNEGLNTFKYKLETVSSILNIAVEISVLSFGSTVTPEQEFVSVDEWKPREPLPNGATALGKAIEESIKLGINRREYYESNNITHATPIIFIITGGYPTDMCEGDKTWQKVTNLITDGTQNSEFELVLFGIGDKANIDVLEQLVINADNPGTTVISLDSDMITSIDRYLMRFVPN
jgi:uncharacterized protein YegL